MRADSSTSTYQLGTSVSSGQDEDSGAQGPDLRYVREMRIPFATAISLAVTIVACTPSAAPTATSTPTDTSATASAKPVSPIVKATSCKPGPMTYLGFRGAGAPPPALVDEIKKRFPDAAVVEFGDGMLGVVIAEPHSWDVRGRHEAAAAAVGWKGDVVDFPIVAADCSCTFNTPMPPPH